MGVSGLWDVLRPVGDVHSLTHLAVNSGFVANNQGLRAYRIGIDASIWFFHAQGGREGENPELRTLFFRCARLLAMPFLPIFVFDGPKRPKIKRGKAIGGKEHWMVNSLRVILDAFGFECRTAPGEAEAELAYLNRMGVIDAVLSDDVDCFLFNALTVIRNSSTTLSGNRNQTAGHMDGKEDGQHVHIYRLEDIKTHPAVSLSPAGLILIALLRGGDYDQQGIDGFGVNTAYALARAGFGDSLVTAARSANPAALPELLPTWRNTLRHELRTNASGFAPRKSPVLAQRITDDFPRLDVLRCYTHPVTSESDGSTGLDGLWQKRPDVAKIAHVCEMFFEWGVEKTIVKRFRSFLWPGAVLRTLLQLALDRDEEGGSGIEQRDDGAVTETPSKGLARTLRTIALEADSDDECDGHNDKLVMAIRGERRHTSTDNILEYRLEINPRQLVARARSGIQGIRTELKDSAAVDILSGDEDGEDENEVGKKKRGTTKRPPDPDDRLRIWMPAVMVVRAHPDLVEEYLEQKASKERKARSGKTNKVKTVRQMEEEEESPPRKPVKPKTIKLAEGRAILSGRCLQEDEVASDDSVTIIQPRLKVKAAESKTKVDTLGMVSQSSKFKSAAQRLDEDPFVTTVFPSARTVGVKSKPKAPNAMKSQSKAQKSSAVTSKYHCELVPRPFPLAAEGSNAFSEPAHRPAVLATANSPPTREYTYVSSPSSDTENIKEPAKKSPRKSTGHASPGKHRSSSSRAPLLAPKVKPLQVTMARISASKMEDDVIIISSDSDIPPPKAKANPLPRARIR